MLKNILSKIGIAKKLSLIGILYLFSTVSLNAQNVSYDSVYNAFTSSFDYENIIHLSDELIKKGDISDSLLTEVYMMRAATFLSLHDVANERESLLQILKLNRNYQPNTTKYSPNLLNDFNDIKINYLASIIPPIQKDSTQIQTPTKIFDSAMFGNSAALNLFIPGLGQLKSGNTTKGMILTAASTVALGSMIYAIINTNNKENDYLKESNENLISAKYNSFNNAYKTRNVLILTYAAIWAFSQIDFIFNSDENNFMKNNTSLGNNKFQSGFSQVSFGFSIPLK